MGALELGSTKVCFECATASMYCATVCAKYDAVHFFSTVLAAQKAQMLCMQLYESHKDLPTTEAPLSPQ